MSPRFGTDGVRGRAYEQLSLDYVRRLGRAAAAVLGAREFYVGRDTRESGPDLERALAAGFADGGAGAISLGVVPTPAVAWLSAADRRPGAMISASHNPYYDNGVKLFAAGGAKLSDERQDAIQRFLDADPPPPPENRGALSISEGAAEVERYCDAVVASIEGRRLGGLRIVIDCANGSNSRWAEPVLSRLGASVEVIHAAPDGRNINEGCGSTHPQGLQRAVLAARADAGLAFDGDADRVLAVDHEGDLVDGDQIIAICAIDRAARERLPGRAVAVTVMTNLGFRLAMAERSIEVIETPVGDRYVLEALERRGAALGGEQSGHVIFRDLATTGDGLLTAVQLLDAVARRSRPLAELAQEAMVRLPQVLRNVALDRPVPGLLDRLGPAIAAAEARLGARGRVLVRPSGTEPLVRVMVEAPTAEEAEATADSLATSVAALA